MLQHSTPVAPASYEVIIVLGAAVWPGERPSPALQRRVVHAVALMQCGAAAYLLLTGGIGVYPPAEAEVMQRLALAHGVSGQRILLEDQAMSTLESALRCRAILQQRGWSRVLVVTDRYHLARALLAFRGCGIRAVGSGVPGRPAPRLWQCWYAYLREGLALVWYLVRLVPVTLKRWRHGLA